MDFISVRNWISDWRFEPNVTPFSRWHWPVISIIFYFAVIYVLQSIMVMRKPVDIPRFLVFHNFSLSIASLLLGSWITYTLISSFLGGLTPYQVLCSSEIYDNGHMQMIYYINMFFKMWEFVDTFLLVLRKKPVAFLHAYHHAATLFLTWSQMVEHSAPQWVPIALNLWVHVLMYYYYAMSALRIRVWWKKYLTTLQIAQFIVDVIAIGYAYATFIRAGFDPNVCYGTSRGALIGLGILISYLLLFVRFYVQTYSKTPQNNQRKSGISEQSDGKKAQ